ncbi:MAG: DUF1329 domain-containing protein [Oligoflexia bacterium]|nr:DUF1329 domain-containing protein [Oligoflexia bacterium]
MNSSWLKFLRRRDLRSARLLACLLLLISASVAAQPKEMDLPVVARPTPALAAAGQTPRLINASNAAEFRELLPDEIYSLVRTGALVLEAQANVNYEFPAAPSAQTEQAQLDGNGLSGASKLSVGAPFLLNSDLKLEGQGARLLWNTNSVWWSRKILDLSFELIKIGTDRAEYVLDGTLQRIYQRAVDPSEAASQIFRELIRFQQPGFLQGLSWLTFRYFGKDEDSLWVYSPAISRTRQLTSSNRADALIKSGVTPDDLLVWSGNPQVVEARVTTLKPVLVPAPPSIFPLANADGCGRVGRDAAATLWNFETGKFAGAAPWSLVGVVFVPREAVRVELQSRDPFALYGRQVLYVDRQTLLPIYKIVYDRAGRLWKAVIGVFGFAKSEGAAPAIAFPISNTVYDFTRSKAFGVDFSIVRFCERPNSALNVAMFDPSVLGPEPTPAPHK